MSDLVDLLVKKVVAAVEVLFPEPGLAEEGLGGHPSTQVHHTFEHTVVGLAVKQNPSGVQFKDGRRC